jgi:hypothetical protein
VVEKERERLLRVELERDECFFRGEKREIQEVVRVKE